MALSIRNPEAERLARDLARATGSTMTEVIIDALKDKSLRMRRQPGKDAKLERVLDISRRCIALPTLDERPEAEILGYGPDGMPG